jgi:hypothetical protein
VVVCVVAAGGSPLRVSRITLSHQAAAGHLLDQLVALAADTWQLPGHPGWRLVTEGLVSHLPDCGVVQCCLLLKTTGQTDVSTASSVSVA